MEAILTAVGVYLPREQQSNDELGVRLGRDSAWIERRTGIRFRRIAGAAEATSDLGFRSAQAAIRAAAIDPLEVDGIILATSLGDSPLPPSAPRIAQRLGARRAWAYDLSASYAGFLYALATAREWIRSGAARRILVIGAEVLSRMVRPDDLSTAILFGDGAGAVLLEASPDVVGALGSAVLEVDGELGDLLFIPAGGTRQPTDAGTVVAGGQFFHMQGQNTLRHAADHMQEAAIKAIEASHLSLAEVDLVIPHQANGRILDFLARRMGLPLDRFSVTLDRFGNVGNANLPLALWDAWRQNRLQPGMNVLFVTFGGTTWGAAVWRVGRMTGDRSHVE